MTTLSLLVLCLWAGDTAVGLNVALRSLEGTQGMQDGLTQKQLALLRTVANWTVFACAPGTVPDPDCMGWSAWPSPVPTDDACDSNACLRYQLAAIGYAAALAAAKTPAYRSIHAVAILRNVVERMLDLRVWDYVQRFANFRRQPTFPDPVRYKNVMYSGHLAQLLTLYEALTGDTRFSTTGFQLHWNSTTAFHYTTPLLLQVILNQMDEQHTSAADAGLACEPDSIFLICNSFPRNAFLRHNANGGLAPKLNLTVNERWAAAVQQHALANSTPAGSFFKLDYLIVPGLWEPLATAGSDVWALAWLAPWWSATAAAGPALLQAGYAHLHNSSQWRHLFNTTVSGVVPQYLAEEPLGNMLFPFTDAVSTSLWPLVAKQYRGRSVRQANDDRLGASLAFLEDRFARLTSCRPGAQCYFYDTGDAYRVFATGNALAGMLLPEEDGAAWLRSVFLQPPFNWSRPHLASVPYPTCMVMSAVAVTGGLEAKLVTGDNTTSLTAACANITLAGLPPGALLHVYLDGIPQPWSYTREEGVVTVAVALLQRDTPGKLQVLVDKRSKPVV